MNHDQEAEDKLTRGRIALYIEHPFYGILSLRLVKQQDRSIPTACVSNTTLYYNPDFINKLDEELVPSLWAHEVQHCMLDHMNRTESRIPKKWNAACDYVINANLKRDNLSIGKTWLFNSAYNGMSADHVYTLLPDGDPDGKGPDGEGGWGALDEMRAGEGDADAMEKNKIDWEMAVSSAANECKKQGTLPKSMERFVEQLQTNKVSWQERLRRFATEHTKNDYSWSRPNRRMLAFGIIMPSLYSEAMGLIVNDIDTSGSIDQHTLNVFGAELTAIKNQCRPQRMINIYCDARVNRVDEFGEFDEPTYKMCGGGGTDFRPPFKYVRDKDLKPACMIYLTDGEGTFPKEPPPYPVMWVMTTDIIAPFGETIRIEL
jgi:predicted metal-dependent peptidase